MLCMKSTSWGGDAKPSALPFTWRVVFSVWQSFRGPQCHPAQSTISGSCVGAARHQGKGDGQAAMPSFPLLLQNNLWAKTLGLILFPKSWLSSCKNNDNWSLYFTEHLLGGRNNAKCFKCIVSVLTIKIGNVTKLLKFYKLENCE